MRATQTHTKLIEKINTLAPLISTIYKEKLLREGRTGGMLFTLVVTNELDKEYVLKTLNEYDSEFYIEDFDDEVDLLALAILLDAYKQQLADKLFETYAAYDMIFDAAKLKQELIEILEEDNIQILDEYKKKYEVMRV